MLNVVWSLLIGLLTFTFDGFVNYIAAKGKNEFGGPTALDFNFDGQIMCGLGNSSTVPGSLAKTPMIRVESHF